MRANFAKCKLMVRDVVVNVIHYDTASSARMGYDI